MSKQRPFCLTWPGFNVDVKFVDVHIETGPCQNLDAHASTFHKCGRTREMWTRVRPYARVCRYQDVRPMGNLFVLVICVERNIGSVLVN